MVWGLFYSGRSLGLDGCGVCVVERGNSGPRQISDVSYNSFFICMFQYINSTNYYLNRKIIPRDKLVFKEYLKGS